MAIVGSRRMISRVRRAILSIPVFFGSMVVSVGLLSVKTFLRVSLTRKAAKSKNIGVVSILVSKFFALKPTQPARTTARLVHNAHLVLKLQAFRTIVARTKVISRCPVSSPQMSIGSVFDVVFMFYIG